MKKITLTNRNNLYLTGQMMEAVKLGYVINGERKRVKDLDTDEVLWMVHMKLKPTKNPTRTAGLRVVK